MKNEQEVFQEVNGFGAIGDNESITITKNRIYEAMIKYANQFKVKNKPFGSFRKRTFIEVFCAKYGVRYSDNDDYEKVFTDRADAIETITMDDNWLVKGKDAFCENCQV